MPHQGNLRSGVYRSFIMCDDPRGVVESGAIRKQKSRSNSSSSSSGGGARKNEHPWKGKQQRVECEEKTEMPKSMTEEIGFDAASSLQLLRVSRRIQKLNVAIESWSKGLSYEARPDVIAKDLLRGALDLEESLAMLGRIQEASSENVKQKPRTSSHGKEGRGDVRFQRSMSDRFDERNRDKFTEKQRIPDEVSSRDCYEELRKAIRESFLRQNLLPGTTGAKNQDCRSKFGASSSGAASTSSSSQSSTVHGNDSGSTKSFLSSDIPPRSSAKGPNLIARLMGLDGFPMEQEKSKVTHINKPEIKKPSSEGREQMKKSETLETVQRKVVVRSDSVKEIALQSPPPYLVSSCCPEDTPISSPSTIVLIKPLRVPQPDTEVKAKGKMPVVPKKPTMQGEIHPRMMSQRKDRGRGSSMTSNKMKLPLSLRMRDRDLKNTVGKTEEQVGKKTKQTTSTSTRNSNTVTRAPKPVATNNKLVKKADAEAKDRRRSHDPVRKSLDNPTAHSKSNNSSEISWNKISTGRRSKSDSNSTDEQKKVRAKKVGEAKRRNIKKKFHQQDNAGNDLTSENNSVSSRDTSGSVNQVSAEEETTSSEFHIQGHCESREISSCDAPMQHSHDCKHHDAEISLKSLLSSSPAFFNYAENLFDLNTNIPRSPTSSTKNRNNNNNIVISDQRLALDCAREVATRKSLQLSQSTCHQRLCISMDELLMEVCNGLEVLRSYSNTFSGQNYLSDSVHMMLEKDLKGMKTEMASGIWDLGWRTGFRIDDTHQVVIDVEKLILFGLIEEIIS